MSEKNRKICNGCSFFGNIVGFIYIILTLLGENTFLFALRVFCSLLVTIIFAIKFKIELSSNKLSLISISIIMFWIFVFSISTIQLIELLK